MPHLPFLAAIDSGSVTLRALILDRQGSVLKEHRIVHEGKLAERLAELLTECGAMGVGEFVATGDLPEALAGPEWRIRRFDARLCLIEGAKAACPGMRTLLHVGAERFFLYRFAPDGTYLDLKSNSSCAAGTGGFLDQQARRLSLADSAELGRRAMESTGQPPRIASRCSVFAKTDLIHAQQEGYGLGEICDGLCRGLVATMCDAVLAEAPAQPFVFSGGVSLNRGVLRALEERLGFRVIVPELPDYLPARGAAIMRLAELKAEVEATQDGDPADRAGTARHPAAGRADRAVARAEKRLARLAALAEAGGGEEPDVETGGFRYPPLELSLSEYPDFRCLHSYLHAPSWSAEALGVEVDRYADRPAGRLGAWLGLDIGSTSTKAVLLDQGGEPLAGFYTRTAGQPLDATRSIFEAIEALAESQGWEIEVSGAATTGSGRKFIGAIIGADLALDEISAHARAAAGLAEGIDTIIEIGGQDAKFTTLRGGAVTFSRMNSVCAAGTGSFIEEQAQKLGVALSDYAALAMGIRAPAASDRCTVFMERDINHYLSKGHSTREILAAVLFSVRENYLLKVAESGSIGERVCFQGATARNKALVAAFEQKLGKPIFVSRYCHLTGALGAALSLREEHLAAGDAAAPSAFRGLGIHKAAIPIETEICELCRNHCRIRVVQVAGEKVAFGFLCGRDYETKRYVASCAAAPSLMKVRDQALRAAEEAPSLPAIGYPFALQGVEELPLWRRFFSELGIPFVCSESLEQAIALGKKESGAEFCAPVTAFHGHVRHLAERSDALFLPVYLEKKEAGREKDLRKYCYYTQYSAALVAPMLGKLEKAPAVISPLFADRGDPQEVKAELYKALEPLYGGRVSPATVNRAYDAAASHFESYRRNLAAAYRAPEPGKIAVALLGRPYTVLSASMNKSIPGLFSAQGADPYYQDMLPVSAADPETEKLLSMVHWHYAASILRAASFCASAEGLYPVFVTSFKCAPDSFVQEYLSRIMEKAGKPYLVLQLDEHDSNVGYETRIEAAVRSFRNHRAVGARAAPERGLPVAPAMAGSLKGKKILMPAWDPVSIRLLAASLRRSGYDARALAETPELVSEGLKSNTGQCIPVNVIAHEYAEYLRRNRIRPEDAVLWMIKSGWACNIGMYPAFIRSLLEKEGGGMEKAGVYLGDMTMIELGPMVTGRAYFAYLFAGYIHRLACRVRPYEVNPGQTDAAAERALEIFEAGMEGRLPFKKAAREVGRLFKLIPRDESGGRRVKVAIFGDLYLRDNPVMNQGLVKAIEASGGEVVVISYAEYTKIVCSGHFKHWIKQQKYTEFVFFRALIAALQLLEDILADGRDGLGLPSIRYEHVDVGAYLEPFGVKLEQEGETYDNILKVQRLMRTYPDIGLFVHTSPAFCCPSLVTEALAPKIEEVTGVPVVNIIYDGTSAYRNDVLAPYLRYPRKKPAAIEKSRKAG